MKDFPTIKRKSVAIKKLRLSARAPAELWNTLLGLKYGLRCPELLSTEAIIDIALIHPVHVVEENQACSVIANHRVANLLTTYLPPSTRIPVLVWPREKYIPVHTAVFLSCIALGLDDDYQFGILNLYIAHTKQELLRLSSGLISRSGLERLTGVSRKLKAQSPVIVNPKSKQLSLGWEDNDAAD